MFCIYMPAIDKSLSACRFHEFGHGLQWMLTETDNGLVAGINNVEWDAGKPSPDLSISGMFY